ncbi:hypothetical protein [Aureivirga sp. CE67]|uniref:hypothetical protein n=1 Tax=Aureivirga sp. CE67 TaxID=1788983 RepID=UPI0018C9D553|nr:hypothetical protein [Aureivirga sp. CE67]
MATQKKQSEAKTLEFYKAALENTETQTEIAAILAEFGYDATLIAEGKTILAETEEAFRFNKKEDIETSQAYRAYDEKKEELEQIFSTHRKKAKVVFRKEPGTLSDLEIIGVLPKAYTKWMEKVKLFYNTLNETPELAAKLVRLKITAEDITTAISLIDAVEKAKNHYLIEKGESQDATKQKNQAFEKADDWMSEFFSVAKIGLEDRPQLMEALGKVVLS